MNMRSALFCFINSSQQIIIKCDELYSTRQTMYIYYGNLSLNSKPVLCLVLGSEDDCDHYDV